MLEEDLKSSHELYRLIQNQTRRDLLEFIYQEPRNYKQLMEFSKLKPGSLYHHLNVMAILVEKLDHGLYGITASGADLVETIGIVQEQKPRITDSPENSTEEHIPNTGNVETSISFDERINEALWLSKYSIVAVFVIILVMILLAIEGVSLSGTALYSSPSPMIFNLLSLSLGWLGLLMLELKLNKNVGHNHIYHAGLIRFIGMLPASVVGITVLLLFYLGLIVSSSSWILIFSLTLAIGYLTMVKGLQYLRGWTKEQAVNIAIIPTVVDLLIGFTILLVQ